MQRDARGRFIKGNTVATGNKGNRNSKHGNNNAFKHGLHSRQLFTQQIIGDDLILIAFHKSIAVRFFKDEWINHGDGFTILGDKAIYAQELLGWDLTPVRIKGEQAAPTIDYEQFIKSSLIVKKGRWFNTLSDAIDEHIKAVRAH